MSSLTDGSRGAAARTMLAWCAGAVVLAAACAAYLNTLDGEWVWDDVSSVLLHKHVQEPAKFFQLFREDQHAFGRGQGNFYRPLVAASFMVDYAISGGPSPETVAASGRAYPEGLPTLVFHLSNMFWHAAAAAALLGVLLALGAPLAAAFSAALVFAVHPLHTEAVAYISGRADMMSAAFMLLGMMLVLRADHSGRGIVASVAGLLSFVLALLSKESSLIFPVLLGLGLLVRERARKERGEEGGGLAQRLWPLAGAGVVLLGYLLLRATVLSFAEGGGGEHAPLARRLVETFQAFFLYMKMLFWPVGLHMERTLDGVPGWAAPAGAGLFLLLAALAVLAFRGGKTRIAAGIVWFLAAWIPISGIFPINAPLAEHWMYVPMAGFWWAFFEGIFLAAGRIPLGVPFCRAAVAAMACMLLWMTVERNRDWHDNERLFRATLRENPKSARVHFNLAVTCQDLRKNLSGARRHYEAVLRLKAAPGGEKGAAALIPEMEVRASLGRVLEDQGDMAAAAAEYEKALNLAKSADPGLAMDAVLGLGRCRIAMGEWFQAAMLLQRVAQQNPQTGGFINRWLAGAPMNEDW